MTVVQFEAVIHPNDFDSSMKPDIFMKLSTIQITCKVETIFKKFPIVLLGPKHAALWKATRDWRMGGKSNEFLLINQTRYRAEIKYLGSAPAQLTIEKT